MRGFRTWAMLVLFLAAICGVLWLWWNFDVRWRPHVISRDQDQIAKLLAGAGWVSPGLAGPKLYVITAPDCAPCTSYDAQLPALQKAGVDTRVIMIAPADMNGVAKSTPLERSQIAELWVNRSWALFQALPKGPKPAAAPLTPPADGDIARSAVIEAGRDLVDRLTPLLKENGVKFAYPVLVWWTPDGTLESCACTAPQMYGPVRKDLGVK